MAIRSRVAASGVTRGEIRDALAEVQRATRKVLDGVRGLPGLRPVDLQDHLGIDLKLAWKVARIAQSGDPFASVSHLPGIEAWSIWLDAAVALGASRASADSATRALQTALSLGMAWAGSRQGFSTLAASTARDTDGRLAIEQRRQFHQAAGFTWGIRAELGVRIDILAPDRRRGVIDCATVRAFVGLERLRPDAAFRLEAPAVVDDRGSRRSRASLERLDAGDRSRRPPFLLRDLCSRPLPPLTSAVDEQGSALDLGEGDVGPQARMTLVHGLLVRAMQPSKPTRSHHGIFQIAKLRAPVATQVFDLIVHRELLAAKQSPEAILYGDLWHGPERKGGHGARHRLPFAIEVVESAMGGRSRAADRIDGWPDAPSALALAFTRTGWAPEEFRRFRATIAYPPVPSSMVMEAGLTG